MAEIAAGRAVRVNWANRRIAALGLAVSFALLFGHPGVHGASAASVSPAPLQIVYPLNGSIFPPEITAPTFLWRDSTPGVKTWTVKVSSPGIGETMIFRVVGEPFRFGPSDPKVGPPPELTPEQGATHTWKPDPETWARIKRMSTQTPATLQIEGL